jgi:hypothetical protein
MVSWHTLQSSWDSVLRVHAGLLAWAVLVINRLLGVLDDVCGQVGGSSGCWHMQMGTVWASLSSVRCQASCMVSWRTSRAQSSLGSMRVRAPGTVGQDMTDAAFG